MLTIRKFIFFIFFLLLCYKLTSQDTIVVYKGALTNFYISAFNIMDDANCIFYTSKFFSFIQFQDNNILIKCDSTGDFKFLVNCYNNAKADTFYVKVLSEPPVSISLANFKVSHFVKKIKFDSLIINSNDDFLIEKFKITIFDSAYRKLTDYNLTKRSTINNGNIFSNEVKKLLESLAPGHLILFDDFYIRYKYGIFQSNFKFSLMTPRWI